MRVLWLLADGDLPAHVAEPTPHLGDHQMPADELDRGVGAVDLVDPGHWDDPIVLGPKHADCSIRHLGPLLPAFVGGHNTQLMTRQQRSRVRYSRWRSRACTTGSSPTSSAPGTPNEPEPGSRGRREGRSDGREAGLNGPGWRHPGRRRRCYRSVHHPRWPPARSWRSRRWHGERRTDETSSD